MKRNQNKVNQTAGFEVPWQRLIDSAAEGTFVLDAQGTIRYANSAAAALLGLELPDGAAVADWLSGMGEAHRELLLSAIEGGSQVRIQLPGAVHKHLVFEAELLADVGATRATIRPDHEAEAAETMAILIHDLRLPMTSIMGYSKMLSTVGSESLNDTQRQFLDTIERNVKRLENNLAAAQDMTRLERRLLKLAPTFIAVPQVAAKVLQELDAQIEDKGHHVSVDFPDNLLPVYADAVRLQQILGILLDNAVKYTPPGGNIRLRARPADDLVRFDVTDSGICMSPAEQKQVFTKFFRSEDERVREYHGLGLSLYIARGLVQLQGGQLWFECFPGQGTTFSFTLPSKEAA